MRGVKLLPTANDTICKIIINTHMKCCEILYAFCNSFSVYFAVSIYSKIPKTKSCLFADIEYKPVV